MESTSKRVTKGEFSDFLMAYPNPLERDVYGAAEPPVVTYNDFSDGKVWPESAVAYVVKNSAYDSTAEDDYYIKG